MAYEFPTPEWVAAYEKAVKEDADYKEVAKDWEGSVSLKILANPDLGLDEDAYILMDLWHGDARSIRLVPKEEGEKSDYLITGDFAAWKSVVKGQLDVIKGMLSGKLKLRGDLPTIVKNVKAAKRMVALTSSIETLFPDEFSPPELDKFKARVKEFRAQLGV